MLVHYGIAISLSILQRNYRFTGSEFLYIIKKLGHVKFLYYEGLFYRKKPHYCLGCVLLCQQLPVFYLP